MARMRGRVERPPAGGGPRLSTVWVAAALVVPAVLGLGTLSTVDLAYLVRAGRLMLESGDLLRHDPFTFTAMCRSWTNQQWGTELVLAAVYDGLGWLGLALVRSTLATGVAAFVFAASRRAGATRRAAAWLTIAASLVVLGGLQLRAQLIGLVLFAALRWLVAGRAARPARLWWAVPITLVWANTHGSFPLVLVVLGFAALEDRVTGRPPGRTLLVGGACALATLATPFGLGVWTYVAELSTDPVIRDVVREWGPPSPATYTGLAFFATTVVAAVAFVRGRRELPWPAWAELGVFLVLAASSTRAVHWWAIVLAVTLARLPWARREPASDPRNRLNVVLVGALALVPAIALVRWLPHAGEDPPAALLTHAPVALTERLGTVLEPGEPFANAQSWGSWFELALPGHPVFVDSRFELLPEDAVRASLAISRADPGWEERLDGLPVRVLVVDRATQPDLVDALPSATGWRVVVADDDGLVLTREGAAPAAPLPPCGRSPG
jgi:hypothetical protein